MIKHSLQVLLEEQDIEVRSYSGRGMSGKECLGVNICRDGLGNFIGNVLRAIGGDPNVNLEEIAEAFDGLLTDSMGKGQIIYFPDVPFVEIDEDLDEEEEEDD